MIKKLTGLVLMTVVLVPLSMAGQSAKTDKTPRLETLVPAGTLLLCSVLDVPATAGRFMETVPGRLLEHLTEEENTELLRNFGLRRRHIPSFQELDQELTQFIGHSLAEIAGAFTGEFAVAVVDIKPATSGKGGEPKLDLVVKIGWNDPTKFEKLIELATERVEGLREYKHAGARIITCKSTGPVTSYWAVTPLCFIYATQEARIKEVVAAVMAGKPIEKNMTNDAAYQLSAKTAHTNGADLSFYWNVEKSMPFVRRAMQRSDPKAVEWSGLASIGTIAYSLKIKDNQLHDIAFIRPLDSKRPGFLKTLSTAKTETKDGLVVSSSGDVISPTFVAQIALAVGIIESIPDLIRTSLDENEEKVARAMRDFINAASRWKMGDWDRNGVNDYWVADISGMYRIEQAGSKGIPVANISLEIARADADPFEPKGGAYVADDKFKVNLLPASFLTGGKEFKPVPYHGYYFEAIQTTPSGAPYAELFGNASMAATNVNRFGFMAYPAKYGETGIHTFVVWENGVVFMADLGTGYADPPVPLNPVHPGSPPPAPWMTID